VRIKSLLSCQRSLEERATRVIPGIAPFILESRALRALPGYLQITGYDAGHNRIDG